MTKYHLQIAMGVNTEAPDAVSHAFVEVDWEKKLLNLVEDLADPMGFAVMQILQAMKTDLSAEKFQGTEASLLDVLTNIQTLVQRTDVCVEGFSKKIEGDISYLTIAYRDPKDLTQSP